MLQWLGLGIGVMFFMILRCVFVVLTRKKVRIDVTDPREFESMLRASSLVKSPTRFPVMVVAEPELEPLMKSYGKCIPSMTRGFFNVGCFSMRDLWKFGFVLTVHQVFRLTHAKGLEWFKWYESQNHQANVAMVRNLLGQNLQENQSSPSEGVQLVHTAHTMTAAMLGWTLQCLAQYPKHQERVQLEVGKLEHVEDQLKKLSYTKAVVAEVLRLCPIVPYIDCHATTDDEIGGFQIPKNAIVRLWFVHAHRDPRYWFKPLQFSPLRFLKQRQPKKKTFAYMPFAGAPHSCIARNLALRNTVLIIASLMQRFQVRVKRPASKGSGAPVSAPQDLQFKLVSKP